MFSNNGLQPLRTILARVITVAWVAIFTPGPALHVTTAEMRAAWGVVYAETVDSATDETVLTLVRAVDLALAGNPGLKEIKARAEALAAVPPQAGALPDPTVNFDMLNVPVNSFDLRREDMTMLEVGVSQTLPFPGKLALREKIAEHDALAAAASVDEARLRLVRDVKQAWWRLFYYGRALDLFGESEDFFRQLVDIAQAKYRVGKGSQQDVLLAQLELSKLKNDKLELVSQRHGQYARLNALLDRTPETAMRIPAEAATSLPELNDDVLQEQSLHSRPLFEQHRKMLDAALAKVDLAKKDFYPDFNIGAGYAFRQNTPDGQTRSDFASIRLSMNVPLYAGQKQAKAVDQRQAELMQEQYALQDEHHKIRAELAAKTAEYRHAKERLALLEHEIIPQAQQSLTSLLAGYQVSRADFSDVLRTQLNFFQFRMQYWQTLALSQQILAELSAVVGEELAHD